VKILYVAPENVTGGFALFAKGHRRRGNECRWITFFPSRFDFGEDLCFNLWGMPSHSWVRRLRQLLNRTQSKPDLPELAGNPPIWKPASAMEDILYRLRDLANSRRIRRTVDEHSLNDFDIYHFEQGIDPFRDGRWVRDLAQRGKGIVAFYHGTDLRNRGIIPAVQSAAVLNLTSEIDLLERLPGMKYLNLPIDTESLPHRKRPVEAKPVRICHAARNRRMKGSDFIESTVLNLKNRYDIEWVMIENMPHPLALRMKADCDIYIDQVTDLGGWGYGASSVESLAMGLPTLTRINPQVSDFLGEHPFVSVTPDSLQSTLVSLIENPRQRRELSVHGKKWVEERHGIDAVMETLYGYYREVGLV